MITKTHPAEKKGFFEALVVNLINKLSESYLTWLRIFYDSENHVDIEKAQSALETAKKLIGKIKMLIG